MVLEGDQVRLKQLRDVSGGRAGQRIAKSISILCRAGNDC